MFPGGSCAKSTSGKRLDRRSGQMALFATVSLTALFSMLGLSVDLGYSYIVQNEAQAAADAAATGAVRYAKANGYSCASVGCNSTYNCPANLTSASTALQAGCLYAKANGFVNTGNQTVSLIANNTSLASGAAPALWIQAKVTQTVSHSFLIFAGATSSTLSATATGGVNSTPNSNCVYVLDTASTADAMLVSGGAGLTASGCGVFVNSSNIKALETGGHSALNATTIQVHGNYSIGGSSTMSPLPTINAATVSDPFANVPAPTVSSTCGETNYTNGSATATIWPSIGSGTTNGVYCGGITVSGGTLTMNPGTYILNGGGFNVTGGTITGNGVTIFLTGKNGYTNAPMTISGQNNITLSAPTGGTYQGILFYQDRVATYATTNSIAAGSTINVTGSFYFPGTMMTLAGQMSSSTVAFVVKDLSVTGGATLNQDTTGTATGLAARTTALLQ